MRNRLGAFFLCGGLCLALAACDDEGTSPSDSGAPDQLVADGLVADGPVADGPVGEGGTTDGPLADGQPTDQAVVDGLPPPDGPVADAAPVSLQVVFDKVDVWANLMPIVPPDPTHVNLTLSFTNNGTQQISGIQLIDSAIQPVPTGTQQPIDLVPTGSFNGKVPAGQTVTVDFNKVQKSSSTPYPTCGSTVKIGTTVSYTGGKLGPLWSGDAPFTCAY
jgi:hypothetical protein